MDYFDFETVSMSVVVLLMVLVICFVPWGTIFFA